MLNKNFGIVGFLIVLAGGLLPHGAVAYQELAIVTSVDNLSDIVGAEYSFLEVVLSPDSQHMVWLEFSASEICTYTFDEDSTICLFIPWGDGYVRSTINPDWYLSWSADSQYVAFSRHPYGTFLFDADLWMLDLQAGDVRNLTDDAIDLLPESSDTIDFYPVWNPLDGTLYFLRGETESGPIHPQSLSIYALQPPYNQLPKEIINLNQFYAYAVSVIVSPDGTKIVMYLYDRDFATTNPDITDYDMTDDGVYVVDIGTGEIAKVAGVTDLLIGAPPEATQWVPGARTASIQWTSNSEGLIVGGFAQTDEGKQIAINFHYINLELNAVTALGELNQLVIDEFRGFQGDQLPFQLFTFPNADSVWSASFVNGYDDLVLTENVIPFGDADGFAILGEIKFTAPFEGIGSIYTVNTDGRVIVGSELVQFVNPDQ